MCWGFLPDWYKKLTNGPLLINARAESIAEKPAFRNAARQRRCLIPASGFYEWQGAAKPKTPYYISRAHIFAFAGIWQRWRSPEGQETDTCAIVTCAANDKLAPTHHRMPVVIQPEQYGLWLGEEGKGAALLMKPAPDDFFTTHVVGPAVNSARSDGPVLMEPQDADPAAGLRIQ